MSTTRIALAFSGALLALAAGVACDGAATPEPGPTTIHTTAPTRPTTSAAPPTKPTAKPTTVPPPISAEQRNAVRTAQEYLDTQGYSRKGLIRQLSSSAEGYPAKIAMAAVDSLHANWNAQAAQTAKEYLTVQSYSRNGLIQQLESSEEGFTHSQAVYGVKAAGL